ncbi:uncharacterized protein LOC142229473 [Haematobia irritans]|uniref:uncharacterized protein LOC142229473 n=1 Tax=Haematobia irritans TaxID=7368 RepID=UPI003F4FD265
MDKCFLCKFSKKDDIQYGDFLQNKEMNIGVHMFCLYLSSNLVQNGDDDEGILGFLQPDIKKEEHRVSFLKCCYCSKRYANIGCCHSKCRRTFHLVCGVENGAENQFCKSYNSYCNTHRRKGRIKMPSPATTCMICYDNLVRPNERFNPLKAIESPCCRNGWFHKLCLQRFARTAGYFFKCPLCNDAATFRKELPTKGIFIPNQDAAWELEPNAFAELLERPSECSASNCTNNKGRNHSSKDNPLMLCGTCGSTAMHKQCLQPFRGRFHCADCTIAIEERDSGRESLNSHGNEEGECNEIDVCNVSDHEDMYIVNQLFSEANTRGPEPNNDINSEDEIKICRRRRALRLKSSSLESNAISDEYLNPSVGTENFESTEVSKDINTDGYSGEANTTKNNEQIVVSSRKISEMDKNNCEEHTRGLRRSRTRERSGEYSKTKTKQQTTSISPKRDVKENKGGKHQKRSSKKEEPNNRRRVLHTIEDDDVIIIPFGNENAGRKTSTHEYAEISSTDVNGRHYNLDEVIQDISSKPKEITENSSTKENFTQCNESSDEFEEIKPIRARRRKYRVSTSSDEAFDDRKCKTSTCTDEIPTKLAKKGPNTNALMVLDEETDTNTLDWDNSERKEMDSAIRATTTDDSDDDDPLEFFLEAIEKEKNKRCIATRKRNKDLVQNSKEFNPVKQSMNSKCPKTRNETYNLDNSCIAKRTRRRSMASERLSNSKNENNVAEPIKSSGRRKTVCSQTSLEKKRDTVREQTKSVSHEMSEIFEKLYETDEESENFVLPTNSKQKQNDTYDKREGLDSLEISCIANRTRKRKSFKLPAIVEVEELNYSPSSSNKAVAGTTEEYHEKYPSNLRSKYAHMGPIKRMEAWPKQNEEIAFFTNRVRSKSKYSNIPYSNYPYVNTLRRV